MLGGAALDKKILNEYIERIFLFARNKTYTREEAEDLAQEILLEACRSIDNLRNEERFEPWLFGLANNVVRVFRRKKAKDKALYSYDSEINLIFEEVSLDSNNELYELLKSKLIALSSQYRNMLIMHYYDGLKCKDIAARLNIAEGTVKWRLSEGRKKIKKEWNRVNDNVLKPKSLILTISGSGNYDGKKIPFPSDFINDAVSQNILWHAYEKPKTIEELSMLTGIPAYYIEDKIQFLIEKDALIKISENKYQTDFIIYTKPVVDHINELGEKVSKNLFSSFMNVIDSCFNDVMDIDFYKANRTNEELKWLIAILSVQNSKNILNPLKEIPYEVKYNGYKWAYHSYESDAGYLKGITTNICSNLESEGSYRHIVFFNWGRIMGDIEINLCEKIFYSIPLSENEKELAASMIKDGYLIRTAKGVSVNIPIFNHEEKNKFFNITRKALAKISEEYQNSVQELFNGFVKLFPRHLEEDALRQASWFYTRILYFILDHAVKAGRLTKLPEGKACEVLTQWKEHSMK